MKKIRILIAEDIKKQRDIIVNNLKDYELIKFGNDSTFEITKSESYVNTVQILDESARLDSPFEVFFCDVDFSHDQKGGERDSGFKLIRKAFEISNLTHIYTYSGQVKATDLYKGHLDLISRGLVINSFDKSDPDAGSGEWINRRFNELFDRLEKEKVLWDIWANHNIFKDAVMNTKFSPDPFENLLAQSEITSNLDTILYLLKKSEDYDGIKVIYRLVIQLYHRCLESFCRGGRTYEEINRAYNTNRSTIEELLKLKTENKDKGDAIKAIMAYTADKYAVSGFKVNFYRNKSVHPADNFDVGLSNVLYCSIALALYANKGKWDGIKTGEIEAIAKNSEGKGNRDLLELLYSRR